MPVVSGYVRACEPKLIPPTLLTLLLTGVLLMSAAVRADRPGVEFAPSVTTVGVLRPVKLTERPLPGVAPRE